MTCVSKHDSKQEWKGNDGEQSWTERERGREGGREREGEGGREGERGGDK